LAIFTLGVAYLPIVFANIPSPFSNPSLYLILWVTFIFVFHYKFLLSKNVLPIYLFLLVYFISIPLFWNNVTIGLNSDIDYMWLLKEISWTFLSILMFTYFINIKDYYGLGLVTFTALFFIAITSLTSLIGFSLFPSATREMASGEAASENMELLFRSMGIGTFGFFTGVAFLFPALVYYLKKDNVRVLTKILMYAFSLLTFYALYLSSLTTSILSALVFSILAFTMRGIKISKNIIIFFVVFFLTVYLFNNQFANLFYKLADVSTGSENYFKYNELAKAIEIGDFNPLSDKTYISGERLSRSYYSFVSFLENPLIGGGRSAGHAHWLDRLGLFGLLGFVPWILIFRSQIKIMATLFSDNFINFYYLSFFSFIAFGIFKGGLESVETSFSIFFLVPGSFYIQYLIKHKRK